MTFPALASTILSSASGVTTFNVTMPSSVAAGDLIIVAIGDNGRHYNTPTGWTLVAQNSADHGSVFQKIADGSEGASVAFSQTGTASSPGALAARITGNFNANAESASSEYTTNTSSFDAPSLTPSWGATDTLWLDVIAGRDSRTITGTPTSYTLNEAGPGTAPLTGLASRNLNAASEDPGAATLSGTTRGLAVTIAVRPAAAVTSNTRKATMRGQERATLRGMH